jgi:hypothetical protein
MADLACAPRPADLQALLAGTRDRVERLAVGCWARSDWAPPFTEQTCYEQGPYRYCCGEPDVDTLGLCEQHRAAIFPPEVRADAQRP